MMLGWRAPKWRGLGRFSTRSTPTPSPFPRTVVVGGGALGTLCFSLLHLYYDQHVRERGQESLAQSRSLHREFPRVALVSRSTRAKLARSSSSESSLLVDVLPAVAKRFTAHSPLHAQHSEHEQEQSTHTTFTIQSSSSSSPSSSSSSSSSLLGAVYDTADSLLADAATQHAAPPIVDVVVLAVKGVDATRHAAHQAAQLLAANPNGIVVSLMNGLSHVRILDDAFVHAEGHARRRALVYASTALGAHFVHSNHLRHAGLGVTQFVEPALLSEHERPLHDPATIRVTLDAWLDVLRELGIPYTRVPCSQRDSVVWSKLLVNCCINPLTALLRVPNGALATSVAARALVRKLAAEVLLVAQHVHVLSPAGSPSRGVRMVWEEEEEEDGVDDDAGASSHVVSPARIDRAVAHVMRVIDATHANTSSMLSDVLSRRRTEIDSINGAVLDEARRHRDAMLSCAPRASRTASTADDVPLRRLLPTLHTVVDLIHAVEQAQAQAH